MKKKLEIRVPAAAGAWYIAASLAIKLIGMATTPIYTGVMSAEEYGKYALYMSWVGIFSVVATLGLSASAVYRGMQKFKKRQDELLSATLGLSLLPVFLFSVLFVVWGESFARLVGLSEELIALIIVQTLFDSAVTLYTARCRYLYDYKRAVAISLASTVISQSVALALVFFVEPTAKMRIYALLFSTMLFALPIFISIIFKGKSFFSREVWRFLLMFNLPLLPHFISAATLANADKVMVSYVSGEAALAKYSVAHSLGVGMSFATGGLGSALQPWIMRKIDAGEEERVSALSLKITSLIAIGSLCVLALAPEVFAFLSPSNYSDALISVYPITLAAIAGFISSVAGTAILHKEKTALLSLSAIVGAAVNIFANLFLLPYSYNGAAFAYLLSAIASAVSSVIAARRTANKPIVREVRSVAIFAAAALFSLVLYALRALLVPRLASLLCLGVLALILLRCVKRDVIER